MLGNACVVIKSHIILGWTYLVRTLRGAGISVDSSRVNPLLVSTDECPIQVHFAKIKR